MNPLRNCLLILFLYLARIASADWISDMYRCEYEVVKHTIERNCYFLGLPMLVWNFALITVFITCCCCFICCSATTSEGPDEYRTAQQNCAPTTQISHLCENNKGKSMPPPPYDYNMYKGHAY